MPSVGERSEMLGIASGNSTSGKTFLVVSNSSKILVDLYLRTHKNSELYSMQLLYLEVKDIYPSLMLFKYTFSCWCFSLFRNSHMYFILWNNFLGWFRHLKDMSTVINGKVNIELLKRATNKCSSDCVISVMYLLLFWVLSFEDGS